MSRKLFCVALLSAIAVSSAAAGDKKIRVVIVDGQNNHNWRLGTPELKKALEDSGRFTVDVATTPERPAFKKSKDAAEQEKFKQEFAAAQKAYQEAMAKFDPHLPKYDVLVSNYNGDMWPEKVRKDLEDNLKSGKLGLVIVHAANNSFGSWKEFRQMIGMGWYGKDTGKRLKLDDAGKTIIVPENEDLGPGHRYTGPFKVTIRDPNHPITRGMPSEWLHDKDELYDNMRGPIENVHLLATAIAPQGKGTGVHEPMIWTVSYGKGRVFHTPLGHNMKEDITALRCVGFITTLQRGTEWAATGNVTIPIPANFPTSNKISSVTPNNK